MDPMIGDTAGTVIAAVLENSGLVSQQEILRTFRSFWGAWGTLIFVVASMGMLLKLVLTGRAQGIMFLVIGPSLFYFVTNTTTTISLTKQQLGDEAPTEATIEQFEAKAPENQVEISLLFAIFMRLSDSVVDLANDFILENAHDEEFLFTNRSKALQALMTLDPASPEFMQMVSEPLLTDCSFYLSAVLNLSSNDFGTEYGQHLESLANGGDAWARRTLSFLGVQRQYWEDTLATQAKVRVSLNEPMKQFVKRQTNIFIKGDGGINYAERLGEKYKTDPQRFVDEEVSNLRATCSDAMEIIGDAAVLQGEWLEKFVLDGALNSSLKDDPAARETLCEAVARKIYSNQNQFADCELGPTISLFVLRRIFSYGSIASATERILQRSTIYVGHQANDCDPTETDDSKERYCRSWKVDQPNPAFAALGDTIAQQAADLSRAIMSFAYDIPYFQGLLLYLIGAFFPFAAVLLIIPGRMQGFFTVFMLWFWVKSWDVGFSVVYLLDKVLYNLLPGTDIASVGRPILGDLPDLLRQAAGHDLNADILAHYQFIGFCLSSVPAITGFLIIRAASSMTVFLNEVSNRSTFFAAETQSETDPLASLLTQSDEGGGSTTNSNAGGANTNNTQGNNSAGTTGGSNSATPAVTNGARN